MQEIIIGAVAGALIASVPALVSKRRYNINLKKCIANDTVTDTFTYKGKKYDREKYINMRVVELSSVQKNNYKAFVNGRKKKIEKGKDIELNQAELEALSRAFEHYFPEDSLEKYI
ncbi:MAG: hypothetical protein J5562_02675 [Clostridia bacterium]|nr:hypothetical protein [Clostridia bacterium]